MLYRRLFLLLPGLIGLALLASTAGAQPVHPAGKKDNHSLLIRTKNRQIVGLLVQFRTGKKDQDLKIKEKNIAVPARQSKGRQVRLRQRRAERNALIGEAALLLAVLGLGYNCYYLWQRGNRELRAQQQQINRNNQDLQLLRVEKESLLREIHHRVRNNLQVVVSLLSSQAASLRDEKALSAIQESRHRVYTLALIHQKRYQSEGLGRIPMRDYLEEAVAYLHDAYSLPGPVQFYLSVDDVELDVTQAEPLGLIVNEAVTNALKYAFPGGRSGAVHLTLRRLPGGAFELSIADNGVGLPEGYDPEGSHSLGMTLMHGFGQQLGGQLTITSGQGLRLSGSPGTTIRLVFEEEPVSAWLSTAARAG
jgi:two-component sensor histidine kinase